MRGGGGREDEIRNNGHGRLFVVDGRPADCLVGDKDVTHFAEIIRVLGQVESKQIVLR